MTKPSQVLCSIFHHFLRLAYLTFAIAPGKNVISFFNTTIQKSIQHEDQF